MTRKIKIFTKNDCPKCPAAKKIGQEIEQLGISEVEFYDVEKSDGLAEAQFYSVMATPSLIICQKDENEEEIKSFRGETPDLETIKKELEE